MGWFSEQLKQRRLNDEELFDESFNLIASAVTGKKRTDRDMSEISKDAITTILKFYGFRSVREIPEGMEDFSDQLNYLLRPYGMMYRRIRLTEGWYKDCIGAILAFDKESDKAYALLPDFDGYKFADGSGRKVNRKTAETLDMDGFCFYKPLPNKKLNNVDLIRFAIETRSVKDIVLTFVFMGVATLIGLLTPKLSYFLYGTVMDSKSVTLLLTTIIFLSCVSISTLLFNSYKTMYNGIITTKMQIGVSAATMMRILSLPASFFRKYSSGELSSRSQYLSSLCSTLMSIIFDTGFTSLFSLVYIGSIFVYARSLVVPSLVIILITVSFSIVTTLVQQKITKENMENATKESGISYAMISGIRKIRLAGAEKRAFARWANLYAKSVKNQYNPPLFIKINGVITMTISLVGTIVMYYVTLKEGVSLAEYSAFTAAYGMVYGAFSSLASIALTASNLKPIVEMAKPLMEVEPEISEDKEIVTRLSGAIELNNVYFRYRENMPYVVDDMTLKIKPGQYIAIVGKTGCGKSTLIRLLLGFEKPEKGSIYFDGKDINSLDLKSLRRKIGTVMQDGKLFQGEIFSNITIVAPQLTLDDAWKAADMAGIGDDIRKMPMGMNTLITEGGGGISGGQRQRLLIARAIAPKPKILIFDEATSALDNITQKKVSEALDSLHCTRIVIAHRLSTIRHCDRILYLEDGKIKEDGTYEELIKKNGLFAELVERQRLDIDEIEKGGKE